MAIQQNSLAPRSLGATRTGLIILDHRREPIYFNAAAFRVLNYPHGPEHAANLNRSLPPEIRNVIANRSRAQGSGCEGRFKSGKRTYSFSLCPLIQKSKDRLNATSAVLIERVSTTGSASLTGIVEEFHLTERERQTVQLLTEGLTSKEIASRMNISPNTVKTFVHLIMAKMAVPTRSAILGRLLRG